MQIRPNPERKQMSWRRSALLISAISLTSRGATAAGAFTSTQEAAPALASAPAPGTVLTQPAAAMPVLPPVPKVNAPAVPVPPTLLPAAVPADARLTLQQTLDLAYGKNPLLRAADQTVRSAGEALKAAKLPLDPQVYMDAGYSSTFNQFQPFPAEDVVISDTLEISGRHHYRVQAARATLYGAHSDSRTARLNARQNVSNAYINLQVANQSLEVQTDLYELVAQQTNLTEQQFKLGAARENDVIRLQIALTQAEQALLQARDTVSTARASLNLAIGRPATTPIDAAEPLRINGAHYTAGQLIAQAMRNRPELQSEQALLRNLRVAVSVQRATYFPDLNVAFRPYGLFPDENDLLLTASISFPLPLGSIHHNVEKAKSDLGAEQARAEQLQDQVALDVEAGRLAVETALKIVQSYETGGILTRAASLVERTQKGFEVGGASILDIIDAQNTYRTSLVSYYQAIGSYQQAVAQLERAIGTQLQAAP